MATGTGKTYTAFQIIWRLWKAKRVKRVLFVVDRNILIDKTIQQDFAPFGEVMHKISNRDVRKNYEMHLCLYQAVTGSEEWTQIYRQFPDDFFDLVVIDECHHGSASEDSAWRAVLDYYRRAIHLGLTATPKEKPPAKGGTRIIDPEYNLKYFGNPIYTYSLRQGIEDGFLAPYKVIRVVSDVDALGYVPEHGKTDKDGQLVEQRQYNTRDFDRTLILTNRTELVAKRVWEYLKATDPMAKTIVFCDDQPHAERMRQELVKLIPAATSCALPATQGGQGPARLLHRQRRALSCHRRYIQAAVNQRRCQDLQADRARPDHQLNDPVQADSGPRHPYP
jgi:type I restriction enzyme, R subunit